ncbi:MAG: alginate export family protein [Bacteroidetes bacterium]|nr:alginate export family protein [Bacteroidota bacterium]
MQIEKQRRIRIPLILLLLVVAVSSAFPQGGAPSAGAPGAIQAMTISEVRIVWDSVQPDKGIEPSLDQKIIRAVNIYPNTTVSPNELDMAVGNALRIPEVGRITWSADLSTGNAIILVLHVRISTKGFEAALKQGMIVTGKTDDFPLLFQNKNSMVKINLVGAMMPTLINNTWWGNGNVFTKYNPFGKNPPGTAPALDFEAYLKAGLAGIVKITRSENPVYLYGAINGLGVTTLGRELYNANSSTFALQIEEAYAGIVGAVTLKSGHLFRYTVSFGKQPYRIGTGMLICQIGGNGGTWGGMNAWPRFSGRLIGLAKVAYDRWKLEGFYIQPNDYPSNESHTQMAGFNLEYNRAWGLSGGFTYLNVLKSKFPYFFPDYTQTTRQGTNAMNLRFQWQPHPDQSFAFLKAEGGLELNNRIPMLAWGMAAEGGWSFGNVKLRPAVSYRYSLLSGDNPATSRLERWDFLYSGDDIFTWVQGVLMKNVLFNTNMEVHRFQLQFFPNRWRVTTQYVFIMANQLSSVPMPPSGSFTDKQIGQELLIVAERFVSKHIFLRFTASSLWPGKGLASTLPDPVSQPWTEFQAMIHFNF